MSIIKYNSVGKKNDSTYNVYYCQCKGDIYISKDYKIYIMQSHQYIPDNPIILTWVPRG